MEDYDIVRQLSQIFLKNEQVFTQEIIREKVQLAISSLSLSKRIPVEIDENKLVRELENIYSIWIGGRHSIR